MHFVSYFNAFLHLTGHDHPITRELYGWFGKFIPVLLAVEDCHACITYTHAYIIHTVPLGG